MKKLLFLWWRFMGEPLNVRLCRRAINGDTGIRVGDPDLQARWDAIFLKTICDGMTPLEIEYLIRRELMPVGK